jgi:YegS/Rv2252/BmrU family lipid kinase
MQAIAARVYAVVNPRASLGKTKRLWPRLHERLERRIGPFVWDWTQAPRQASALVRDAIQQGHDLIISVGGDGTHNEVVNGFFSGGKALNPLAALAVVCCGSGADFCRSLDGGNTPEAALEVIISGRIRKMDVGRLEYQLPSGDVAERLFVNVASFGLSARVNKLLYKQPLVLGGSGRFFLATVRALWENRNESIILEVDGRRLPSQVVNTVAAANGRFFGGGMQVAPLASLDDGQLDLVIIGDVGLWDFVLWGERFYRGRHLDHPCVQYCKARTIRAVSSVPIFVEVDGETVGNLPATFTLMPRALRLLVPA